MTRETFDLYTLTLTSVPARALHRVRGGQRPLSDFVFCEEGVLNGQRARGPSGLSCLLPVSSHINSRSDRVAL